MAFRSGRFIVPLTGVAATTGGAIGAVLNPEGAPIIIEKVTLYVTTPSTGAANINVGTAADGITDNSGLISALAINGSITGKAYNGLNPAAKAEHVVLGATEYITATGSATSVGFAGFLAVDYTRVS